MILIYKINKQFKKQTIMKKLLFIALFLVTLIWVSCKKEELQYDGPEKFPMYNPCYQCIETTYFYTIEESDTVFESSYINITEFCGADINIEAYAIDRSKPTGGGIAYQEHTCECTKIN